MIRQGVTRAEDAFRSQVYVFNVGLRLSEVSQGYTSGRRALKATLRIVTSRRWRRRGRSHAQVYGTPKHVIDEKLVPDTESAWGAVEWAAKLKTL